MSKILITKDMIIEDVLEMFPPAEKIIVKYFGQGCRECCKGQMETIAFGAKMHGVNPDNVIEEICAVQDT